MRFRARWRPEHVPSGHIAVRNEFRGGVLSPGGKLLWGAARGQPRACVAPENAWSLARAPKTHAAARRTFPTPDRGATPDAPALRAMAAPRHHLREDAMTRSTSRFG